MGSYSRRLKIDFISLGSYLKSNYSILRLSEKGMHMKFYAEILNSPLAEGCPKGGVSPTFYRATTPPSGHPFAGEGEFSSIFTA